MSKAPKVANGLVSVEQQINETFVSTVSGTVTRELPAAADKADTAMQGEAGQLTNQLDNVQNTIARSRNKLDKANGSIDSARQTIVQTKTGLNTLTALRDQTSTEASAFPVINNGSAMTPFYTLMAIWVGITFLGLILTPQVSERMRATIPGIKGWQCYLGRGMTFAAFALAQATVLGLGDLLYLRVQAVNPFLFMLCLWWTMNRTNELVASTGVMG